MDLNKETGEFKKVHKHGALFFESLKSYSQVSDMLGESLNTPSHIEIVMSPKGMYDYFVHAENPEKTLYNIEDIETGCGFDLEKFFLRNNPDVLLKVYGVLRDSRTKEFVDFTDYIAIEHPAFLPYVFERTGFFKAYLDSKRYRWSDRKGKNKADEDC